MQILLTPKQLNQMGRKKEQKSQGMVLKKGLSKSTTNSLSLYSEIYTLPYYSEGVICLKQAYSWLFTLSDQPDFPGLKSIEIVLGYPQPSYNGDQHLSRLVVISISRDRIQLFIRGVLKGTILADQNQYYLPSSESAVLATIEARRLLEKKIWVRLSRTANTIEVHDGDMVSQNQVQVQKNGKLGSKLKYLKYIKETYEGTRIPKKQWQQATKKYNVTKKQYKPDILGQLDYITKAQLIWNGNVNQIMKAEQSGIISLCHKISIYPLTRLYNATIGKNPSILTKDGNLNDMEKPIQTLYSYLENFSIGYLPKVIGKTLYVGKEYDNWRCLRYSIDSSIKQDYQYINYEKDGKVYKQPMNVLNHLIKLKTGVKNGYTKLDYTKSKDKLMKEILELQLQQAQGLAPGSIGVLEIWPPHTSSPVHNHSDSYGVMKVLAGQVTVENFADLNFLEDTNVPFQRQVYQQDDISWFSENSYSIHRIVNTTATTALTLQAYYGQFSSRQYFQFVDKTTQEENYCIYYPQHDWGDYLRWTTTEDTEEAKFDKQFIKDVISFYGLEENGVIDESFPSFVHVMKNQYDALDPTMI